MLILGIFFLPQNRGCSHALHRHAGTRQRVRRQYLFRYTRLPRDRICSDWFNFLSCSSFAEMFKTRRWPDPDFSVSIFFLSSQFHEFYNLIIVNNNVNAVSNQCAQEIEDRKWDCSSARQVHPLPSRNINEIDLDIVCDFRLFSVFSLTRTPCFVCIACVKIMLEQSCGTESESGGNKTI